MLATTTVLVSCAALYANGACRKVAGFLDLRSPSVMDTAVHLCPPLLSISQVLTSVCMGDALAAGLDVQHARDMHGYLP